MQMIVKVDRIRAMADGGGGSVPDIDGTLYRTLHSLHILSMLLLDLLQTRLLLSQRQTHQSNIFCFLKVYFSSSSIRHLLQYSRH